MGTFFRQSIGHISQLRVDSRVDKVVGQDLDILLQCIVVVRREDQQVRRLGAHVRQPSPPKRPDPWLEKTNPLRALGSLTMESLASRKTWALAPPKPNELTLARRRPRQTGAIGWCASSDAHATSQSRCAASA